MKVILISGGFGNQLFQVSLYNQLVQSGHRDVFIDISFYKSQNSILYFLHRKIKGIPKRKFYFENEFTNVIISQKELLKLCFNKKYLFHIKFLELFLPHRYIYKLSKRVTIINDKNYEEINKTSELLIYDGYWQAAQFIFDQKEFMNILIRNRFNNILEKNSGPNVVLHVRRGDQATYFSKGTYTILTNIYYDNALNLLQKCGVSIDNITICSDDINWCKKNMTNFEDKYSITYSSNSTMIEDFFLMSNSKYLISSNSTFSFLAGYLGDCKIMFIPKRWYIRKPFNFINNFSNIKEC
jgi:hypothetical protein